MSEDKTIPKPHLPKPDGLEDDGLDGNRQKLAKEVCPSQAPVFDETVKLCPHQAPVQKACFGSKGENTSETKVSTKSFSGKGEVREREEKEEAKEEENLYPEGHDARQHFDGPNQEDEGDWKHAANAPSVCIHSRGSVCNMRGEYHIDIDVNALV